MKKGFTLIELLAVIVVLAIIAVIAVPIILNVVKKARESSAVDSAYAYIDAVEKYATMHDMDSTKYPVELLSNREYQVAGSDHNTVYLNDIVSLKGHYPTSGTVTISSKKRVTEANLIIDDFSIECTKNTCKISGSTYTVTLNTNGGLSENGVTVIKNALISSLPIPEKDGQQFVGWYYDSELTQPANGSDHISADTELYAKYKNCTSSTYDTPNYYEFTAVCSGTYNIELWGASGGNGTDVNQTPADGGKGAYTSGNLHLDEGEKIYVYVGGKGSNGGMPSRNATVQIAAGYNGGGNGVSYYPYPDNDYGEGAGGGATDVRYFGSTTVTEDILSPNSELGLNSRIMVAAGGAGASLSWGKNVKYVRYTGGAGGDLIGITGGTWGTGYTAGTGGTQLAGGTGSNAGAFGIGGNGATGGSGGGGGYYGGGGSGQWASAGGGSSYISGHSGSIAIESSLSRSAKTIDGVACTYPTSDNRCSRHYSGKVFSNTQMLSGQASMPTYDGTSTMTGNTGNGYAKVTYINSN